MDLNTVTTFTPLMSLLGGILIGLSAILVMAAFGRVTGISGITGGVLGQLSGGAGPFSRTDWRLAFIAGLVLAPLAFGLFTGGLPEQTVPTSLVGMAVAGLVVGYGTALGSGCTSGHGVCGLARLSPRSLAAVATFMATGFITVFVLRHII